MTASRAAYASASDAQRAAVRLAFSRFRLVIYQASGFAGNQLAAPAGPAPS